MIPGTECSRCEVPRLRDVRTWLAVYGELAKVFSACTTTQRVRERALRVHLIVMRHMKWLILRPPPPLVPWSLPLWLLLPKPSISCLICDARAPLAAPRARRLPKQS